MFETLKLERCIFCVMLYFYFHKSLDFLFIFLDGFFPSILTVCLDFWHFLDDTHIAWKYFLKLSVKLFHTQLPYVDVV